MNEKNLFISLDIGTTNVTAVLFDSHGVILKKNVSEYNLITPDPNTVEQNALDWWNSVKKSICGLNINENQNILGLSISTQRATIVPVNEHGAPIYNAITWMDTRAPDIDDAELSELLLQRTSTQKILWLKQNKPKIYDKVYKFLPVDSFIYHKILGIFVMNPSNAAYFPYSVSERKLMHEVFEKLSISEDIVPEIVSSGTVLGNLPKDIAKDLCLPEDLKIVMGAGDQQCSLLGLGGLDSSSLKTTTGTGTFVDVTINEPLFEFYNKLTHLFILPHALPDKWMLEAVIPGTGAILKWYRDNFAFPEKDEADRTGSDVYDIIAQKASKIPPGSNGLGVIPLFNFGKGIIYGLSFSHNRHSLARAIMESNGYSIRFFIDMFEEFDISVNDIRVDGGGAKSELWRQIQADVTNKPVLLTRSIEDASALGAAILTAVGTGFYESYESAVNNMVHIEKTHQPVSENYEIYSEYYEKYQEMMLSAASELNV